MADETPRDRGAIFQLPRRSWCHRFTWWQCEQLTL